MTVEHRQQLQYGYILHSRPYRDTSSLLDVFTRDAGRVSLVARGVRGGGRARNNARLEVFVPLLFSWAGRGELRTMTGVESAGTGFSLPGNRIISGFYMNELILRLLQRDDPHPQLFACYETALLNLHRDDSQEAALRRYERELLEELGYGLALDVDTESGEPLQADVQYCYYPEQGPVAYASGRQTDAPQLSGRTLLAIRDNDYTQPQVLREAKILMRFLLSQHLDNRPLKSRELYWQSRDL